MATGLPRDRDQTVAPGDAIPSVLLNKLQDMVKGGNHGDLVYVMGLQGGEKINVVWDQTNGAIEATAGGATHYKEVGGPLTSTTKLTRFEAEVDRNGVGSVTVELFRGTSTGPQSVASFTVSTGTGFAIAGHDFSPDHVWSADEYWVTLQLTSAGQKVRRVAFYHYR